MKYILYKTTNLINNFIYIGVHKTETPYEFDKYLGNGIYTNRPNTYEKAKTCFQKAVKEFGIKNFRRETLSTFDTPEEAYAAEALIVNEDFLSRCDVYNMIKGGVINNVNGNKVFKYSATTGEYLEEFESIEAAAKAVKSSGSTLLHSIKNRFQIKGFIFDLNKIDKINLSLYNFKNPIKVYRYNKDGQFDKEYDSLSQAGRDSLDTSATYIQKSVILGYLVKDTYYFSFYKENNYDKARQLQIKNREVHKYSNSGEYLQSYTTQEIAEKENKFSNITKSIKYRTIDKNNFYWSLEKLGHFNVPIHRTKKVVARVDDNGNILKTWESVNMCAKEVGTAVKNVLRKKYDKHKGYKYEYINN